MPAHNEESPIAQGLASLGACYRAGIPINWEAVIPPDQFNRVILPTYAFHHRRYWVTNVPNAGNAPSVPPKPTDSYTTAFVDVLE